MSTGAVVYAGLTQEFGLTPVTIALIVPVAFQEMALAVWLIAKGFDQSLLASRTESQA